MLITIVAGARPNFMKIAPIIRAIKAAQRTGETIDHRLVHTGQHFDRKMSDEFFEQLNIPQPDANLGAGGGSQAEQTAAIMIEFEKELLANPTDLVIVVGDVTSTMACAVTAKKLCIPVAHVEAGIRSGDMTMPEEINRIVTDSICDLFFTTSETANEFLRRSGVDDSKIHFVGNTMIDSLFENLDRLREPEVWQQGGLAPKKYLLLTLHRPANVDDPFTLTAFLEEILAGADSLPIVFPVHPRTRKTLEQLAIDDPRLIVADPLGYLEFVYLLKNALGIITDSGGITEEATVLGVPCMTLRDTTERPETVAIGTNELVGTDPGNLAIYLARLRAGEWKRGQIPELWDGKTAERIVEKLVAWHSS